METRESLFSLATAAPNTPFQFVQSVKLLKTSRFAHLRHVLYTASFMVLWVQDEGHGDLV